MSEQISKLVLDQARRIANAPNSADMRELILETQREIREGVTRQALLGLMESSSRHLIPSSRRGPNNNELALGQVVNNIRLQSGGLGISPDQGYLGLVMPDLGTVYALHQSQVNGTLQIPEDPIAAVEPGYEPMALAKALRPLAWLGSREHANHGMPYEQYWTDVLGLHLGASVVEASGVLLGASGYMPDENTMQHLRTSHNGEGATHLDSEPTEVFRGSGLSDQAVTNAAAGYKETVEELAHRLGPVNWN